MKNVYDVVLRPIISEKADWQREDDNVFTFEVHKGANKFEVRSAIEKIFDVKVADVRTIVVRGKIKRVGKTFGKTRNWKKAFVTLKEGQTIDLFEGV
jgi:large subunit ribosomal protein L23